MAKPTTSKDVFLFIPNLIGYSRVLSSLSSFVLMICSPASWFLAIMLYIYSFTADLFDGMAARKFNQCSTFGGLLDMVTDRCSTLGLLFVLYGEYGAIGESHFELYRLLFLSLAILDIASHWCQMYAAASFNLHHKSKEGNEKCFILVRWYYQIYAFFGYCCVSAEVTYITLFSLAHAESSFLSKLSHVVLLICIPGCATKQVVNVFQFASSCKIVAEHDAETITKNSKAA